MATKKKQERLRAEEMKQLKAEDPGTYWIVQSIWHRQEANFHRREAAAAEAVLKRLTEQK